ncbi:MAG: monovalent cation:proton antiporter-2 (CPA2) family protein [Hyphomicrobiales bacterium]
MSLDQLLFGAFIYLAAAVLAVPLAKRLGLGSVLGYLIAGIVIGPYVLNLVGREGEDVMHVAEFGVVMMLFIIGLELRPSLLWSMRKPILGLGGMQVLLSSAAIGVATLAAGLAFKASIAVGLILALSSTAIVLQTLNEKGLMKSQAGQNCFSVLLFQDIAVIPILALLPLLAVHTVMGGGESDHGHGHASAISTLPAWAQALAVLGAVAGIIVAGRYLMRPVFRIIAETKLREAFTAAALLIVVGIALLMQTVGLSPALGTFVAGVVLAESEYRHELEMDIEPFKGLLLGVFFTSVGASINFTLIANEPLSIASMVLGLFAIKMVVLLILARAFKMDRRTGLFFTVALAQGGEFAFVLFSFAMQSNVIDAAIGARLIAAVALSMALTPILLMAYEYLLAPRLTSEEEEQAFDTIDDGETPVVIAGFGRVGTVVGRFLSANGIAFTVLDHDAAQIDTLRKFGWKVFYGDATRPDLLEAAGCADAKVLVVTINDSDRALEIAEMARKHHPHLKIFVRAFDRRRATELVNAGFEHFYRETFGSSLEMGRDILQALGFRAHRAHRLAERFRKHDVASVSDMAKHAGDEEAFISETRKSRELLEQLMKEEHQEAPDDSDEHWRAPPPDSKARG